MFSVATVFLLLASLIAAAGFAVVAQRRLRQLGMLAAIGATQKHLRLVLVTNGAIVGAIAAVCGTIVGLALWLAVAPTLESAVDHRIDRLSLPWGLIATAVLLAVLAATAAAWWPARTVARVPVMLALSGRPPRAEARAPRGDRGRGADRARHRLPRALRAETGRRSSSPGSWRRSSAPCSWARWRSASSPVWPGDSRSRRDWRCETSFATRPVPGAALAAVTLALGIAATVVVVASAEEAEQAAEPPNLSDRQIRVYLGPPEFPGDPAIEAVAQRRAARRPRLPARRRPRPGNRDRRSTRPSNRARPALVVGDTRVRPTIDLARRVDRRLLAPGIAALRRHARGAEVPRNRPRRGRSGHGLPRRSAASRPTGSSSLRARGASRITPSPTSSGSRPTDASSATLG